MAEIRALIVDDEPLARRGIRQLLAPYSDISVVAECRDGREAVGALATLKPDLVFLDIQMPGLDGFGVVRQHGAERMPMTVFITAHDEFAVRAFEARALDYLVKPLVESRFRNTIARVRERMRLDDPAALASRLAGLLAEAPAGRGEEAPILVPAGAGGVLLDRTEIDWLEAEADGVTIHARGKRFRLRTPLAVLEATLDPGFVRVHRGAIVRLDRVRELKEADAGAEALAVLRDGTEVPVSRRRLPALRARLGFRGPPG